MNSLKKIGYSAALLAVIFPSLVFAQIDFDGIGADKQLQAGGIGAGLTTTSTADNPIDPRILATEILNIILAVLGTLFVGLIVTGGFRLIKADGDSSKIEQAKETMQKAAVGLIIILMAYSISTFVGNSITQSIDNAAPQTGFSGGQ